MSDIHIYEVGPRDGLQNLNFQTPTAEKIDLIKGLHKVGLRDIEITSFVHPKLVPNMADAEEVFTATSVAIIAKKSEIRDLEDKMTADVKIKKDLIEPQQSVLKK